MPTFGSTDDQKTVLSKEGLNLETQPRDAITRVMQGSFAQRKDYGSIGRQVTQERHQAEREKTIKQLGVEPGKMILVKRTKNRKGQTRRVVRQVSQDWRIFVEGLKDPIPLALIVEVLE